MDGGREGAAAHTPSPWAGANTGEQEQGGLRRGALRAVPSPPDLDDREERDRRYTISFDSAAALDRQTRTRTVSRGGSHWALRQTDGPRQFSHGPINTRLLWGGGQRDGGPLGERGSDVDRAFLRVTNLSYMTRATTEARTSGTSSWIASHASGQMLVVQPEREADPPPPLRRARPGPHRLGHCGRASTGPAGRNT